MALLQFTNLNKYGDKRTRIIYNPTTSIGFNPSGFGSFIGIRVFKYKYKHPIMPPGLVQLGGKKYIVPTWQEVLPETTLNDIEWIKPKIKKEKKSKSKTWKFNSSSSDLATRSGAFLLHNFTSGQTPRFRMRGYRYGSSNNLKINYDAGNNGTVNSHYVAWFI